MVFPDGALVAPWRPLAFVNLTCSKRPRLPNCEGPRGRLIADARKPGQPSLPCGNTPYLFCAIAQVPKPIYFLETSFCAFKKNEIRNDPNLLVTQISLVFNPMLMPSFCLAGRELHITIFDRHSVNLFGDKSLPPLWYSEYDGLFLDNCIHFSLHTRS